MKGNIGQLMKQAQEMQSRMAEMQERSVPVALVEQADLSGRVWLHVRTGAYPTPEAAQLRLRDLRRQQGLEGIVVSEAKAGPSS